MDHAKKDPHSETDQLVARLRAGDRSVLAELFQRHRDRLRRMVELRMDARLRGRVDASDVLQDAFLDAAARLDNFLRDSDMPAFLWLRLVVGERLAACHRRHLRAKIRDAGRELSLYRDPMPQASSAALASMLLGRLTSPTHAAVRAEQLLQVQEALNSLDPLEREVVALRNFEQLSRAETARVLGITEEAGAKRYYRALKHLKSIFQHLRLSMVKDVAIVEIRTKDLQGPVMAQEFGSELALVTAQEWARRLLVDFRRVAYVSSTGFAALFKLVSRAKAEGREVKLCGMEAGVRLGAEIVGLQKVVEIHEDEASAMRTFARA